jgi:divalent metal cation (Fe/Co/Zn/Cd) transporter
VGAIWVATDAAAMLAGHRTVSSPAAFAFAAVVAGINTYENLLAWDAVRRGARSGGSLIMIGQLRSRAVKLVSSLVVQAALTIAALVPDPVIIAWADGLGALFVCGFIVVTAVDMVRTGLPDLIDRSVNEDVQAAINRMLTRHFDDYDRLDLVRTRRSGDQVYAEIVLAFRPDITLGEVNTRIGRMKASLREEVPSADVSILPASA